MYTQVVMSTLEPQSTREPDPANEESPPYLVAALYRFVTINDLPRYQKLILDSCRQHDICGTFLIAPEGINGTVAGQPSELRAMLAELDELLHISAGELKFSHATDRPFRRMKVKIKREIITMRAPEANPNEVVGEYVEPQQWNDVISDPQVFVVDTRNSYETRLGTFKGAADPDIEKFTDFKDYVEQNLDPEMHKAVAMYCTGGIRCEKASAYMLKKGFEKVYHLKGGILKYLEEIKPEQSLWEGDCFVFDRRVGVGHGLQETTHRLCFGCMQPLSEEDYQSPAYEAGVSCPFCINQLTPERAEMLRERHRQFERGC